MSTWKSVEALEDGQSVDAATLNKPLSELASRTSYLKEMLDAVGGDASKTSVRFTVQLDEDDPPSVGEVVCIDPLTKRFVKALSSMSVFDVYTASYTTNAVGILVLRGTGSTGVVATFGLVDLSEFDIPSMLETGEALVNGPYYVSAIEPGKLTAHPKGPRIQIGVFTRNQQKSGREVGDFAFVNPQYGDLLSHRHRTYSLAARPAGTPVTEGESETSLGRKRVLGYMPDAIRDGVSAGEDAFVPYLRLTGEWPSRDSVSYTVWLSNSRGTDVSTSSAPSSDFSDAWLHWTSSDPEEGQGMVQVPAFHVAVAVGDHGLMAELDPGDAEDLSSPYSVETDSPALRTWTISMPRYAKGWTSNLVEAESEFGSGTVAAYGVQTRRTGSVHVLAPANVFQLPSENPSSGDTLVVGSTTYEFVDADADTSSLDEGVVAVPIQGTAYQTFRGIAAPYSEDSGHAIVANAADSAVYVGAESASFAGTALETLAVGGGTLSASGGSVPVLVCDDDGMSLYDGGFATLEGLSQAIRLNNGMKLYVRASGSIQVSAGTNAELDAYNGCPGAVYRYAIEMDEDLNAEYPPVPAKSGSLMWNGIELESDSFFGDEAVFSVGPDSLYWYDDVLGRVPWPETYSGPDDDISIADRQRLLFHYVSSFHSETGPVTSLHAAPGSPIVVRRCATGEGSSVGDLELDADLTASVYDSNESGYKAVKAGKGGRLLMGPVVERIVAGPGIELEQTLGQPAGQGTVTISATNASYSGEMDTIALENAKQETIGMFPYVRLLGWESSGTNVPTGFVAKFQVPTGIADDVYRVKLYATVFGEDSFSSASAQMTAGVTMTYNVLPDWTPISGIGLETAALNLKTDLVSPNESLSVDIPFGVPQTDGTYAYKGFDPVLAHNDPTIEDVAGRSCRAFGYPFPNEADCSDYLSTHLIGTSAFGVRPGYIVSVRLSRSAPSTGTPYTGKLGFINLRWSLVRATADETAEASYTTIDAVQVIANLRKVALKLNSGNVRSIDQIRSALLSIANQLK